MAGSLCGLEGSEEEDIDREKDRLERKKRTGAWKRRRTVTTDEKEDGWRRRTRVGWRKGRTGGMV